MTNTTGASAGARYEHRAWIRVLHFVGAGLLAATGAIHLDLYLTGYRTIPTIGGLFLLQVIAALALAVAVAVTTSRLVAAAGALFALSTLGGYLLSIWVGLFGFTEVRTEAGIVAGVIEIATFAVLAAAVIFPSTGAGTGPARASLGDVSSWGNSAAAWVAIAAISVVAAGLLAGAAASAGPASTTPAGRSVTLATAQIGGTTVVTNSRGFTLYWFAPDTATASHCYGDCAVYWPPVLGHPVAGAGVTGRLGTITRTGGDVQATYDGHPLYTYIADTAPHEARGNNITLNGGVWHEVTVSG